MFQRHRRSRRPSTTPSFLQSVPEQDAFSNGSSEDERSVRSLPTEYGRSFRGASNLRPRNPVDGWRTRNLSNVLPERESDDSIPIVPRPSRRPPPNVNVRRSQIFAPAPIRGNESDANNNPDAPPPPRPRGRTWPWQARAQNSSIFTGDYAAATIIPRDNAVSRARAQWPWQERAKRSVIFDILTSRDGDQPHPKPRLYTWDQRRTTFVIKDPSVTDNNASSSTNDQTPSVSAGKQWPWQERAQQSFIFHPPDKPNLPRQIKYVWDQRRSRFSVNLDADAKFPEGSHYKENYVQWQRAQDISTKPAGKPCYKDPAEDNPIPGLKSGKKRNSQHNSPPKPKRNVGDSGAMGQSSENKGKTWGEILALPSPPPKKRPLDLSPKVSQVKGTTCLDIVPVDYQF